MNTVQRIAKNTGVLFVSQVVSYSIGFFFVMYTARYLGAEGFGILSFALAFTGIFGVFADLGMSTLTVREVARDKSLAGKYLGNIAVLKVILAVVTCGLIALFINLLGYPEQTIRVVYLVALSIVFGAFSGMFYSIFQAHEKMEYQSVGQILSSALMLAGALFAIDRGFGVVGFASIYFLVSAIVLGYAFAACAWKFGLPRVEVDLGFWKSTIKEALPFGLSGIFVVIYYWIDSVMLSLMKGNEVVGWYNVAYRLILVLMFIPVVSQNAIFPATSRFFKNSKISLKFISERFFKYMMIIGIPIGIGTTLLANRIILLIFGAEYTPSIIALQILIWGAIFAFIAAPFENLLYSTNKQSIVTIEVGVAAILNVIINLLLIPKYSLVGASVATTAIWIFEFFFVFIWISKTEYKVSNSDALNITLKVLVSGSMMGIFILYFKSNLLITVIFSALIYLCTLYVLRGFDRKDITIIKGLIFKAEQSSK